MRLAQSQQVLPALALRLQEAAEAVCPQTAALLQAALLDNTRRQLQVTAQAVKLARCLNTAGITPLLLKGTALLLGHHGMPAGFRSQVDIDLLVAETELVPACEALLRDGYTFHTRHGPTGERDVATALRTSRHHHHLPPLGRPGYGSLVELHRQPLPRPFQRDKPSQQWFERASMHRRHGADFLIPSREHHLVQLVLGQYLHDGYRDRCDFPVRAGQDMITLLESPGYESPVDMALVSAHCGPPLAEFTGLLAELMDYPAGAPMRPGALIHNRLKRMRARYESPVRRRRLDRYARMRHLARALRHNSGKLPDYLARRIVSRRGGL